MRALKFAGLVTCGLALSVTTAAAAPQVLDDAALDGVVAGVDFPGDLSETIANVFQRPSTGLGGFPSLFPRPEPEPEPVVVILLEEGTPIVQDVPGGTQSQSVTTGDVAEQARQNPGAFLPQPTPRIPFTFSIPTWR
jgi:hypothetical protein